MKKPDQTVEVKLIDGPLAGRTITVQKGADFITIGPLCAPLWVYSYAGKDGRTRLFAKHPENRQTRRMMMWYIGKFGKDPRVERMLMRQTPVKRTAPPAAGRGARRREAARVNA